MWPFRQQRTPEATTAGYRRWLRAQRPPWAVFFALSEVEQEALAQLGDEYSTDIVLAVGHCVRDPEAAAAGIDMAAGGTAGEETLARRLADELAVRIQAKRNGKAAPSAPSMGGLGKKWQTPAPSASAPSILGTPDVREAAP